MNMKWFIVFLLMITLLVGCVTTTPPETVVTEVVVENVVSETPEDPESEQESVLEEVTQEVAEQVAQTQTEEGTSRRPLTPEEHQRLGELLGRTSIALIPVTDSNLDYTESLIKSLNDVMRNDGVLFFDVDSDRKGLHYSEFVLTEESREHLLQTVNADIFLFMQASRGDEEDSVQILYFDRYMSDLEEPVLYNIPKTNSAGEIVDVDEALKAYFPSMYRQFLVKYSQSAALGQNYILIIKGLHNVLERDSLVDQIAALGLESTFLEEMESSTSMELIYIGSIEDLQSQVYNLLKSNRENGNVILESQTLNQLIFEIGL